jgi:porin
MRTSRPLVLSILLAALAVATFSGIASGAVEKLPGEPMPAPDPALTEPPLKHHPATWPSLTNDWFGAGEAMKTGGLTMRLSTTQVYQDVAHGGLSTHNEAGRYTGRYDFSIEADLDKMAGLKGASLFASAQGGWSEGIDPRSVGSLAGVNGDAVGNHAVRLREFWFNQNLLDDRLRIRLGKIDLTGGFECKGCSVAFDTNAYANSERNQFINNNLVNNPTIPFPNKTLAAVVLVHPIDSLYLAAGVADANGKVGVVETAFEKPHRYFTVGEAGYLADVPSPNGPMSGAYRVGVWNDPRSKDRFDGDDPKSGTSGFYMSADQTLLKENATAGDAQGLGAFARLGFADEDVSAIRFFWSAGVQYTGLVPGRDADVLGFGVARSRVSGEAGAGFTAAQETVYELYYNIEVTPWLHLSPDIQFIANPGGRHDTRDATVVGLRLNIAF